MKQDPREVPSPFGISFFTHIMPRKKVLAQYGILGKFPKTFSNPQFFAEQVNDLGPGPQIVHHRLLQVTISHQGLGHFSGPLID